MKINLSCPVCFNDFLLERWDFNRRSKESEKNLLKFAAARQYCQEQNIEFKVITEVELKELGLL